MALPVGRAVAPGRCAGAYSAAIGDRSGPRSARVIRDAGPAPMAGTVTIDEEPMLPAELVQVARGAPVELGARARDRIAASRAIVDSFVQGEQLVYGLNT